MTDSPFIVEVTSANFQTAVLEQSFQVPVLVDFWAGWCNPCKMIAPILSKLATEYQGKFYLAKIDTDTERELSARYAIRSLPTIKLFKQGEVTDEFSGVIPESAIREFIDRNQFAKADFLLEDIKELLQQNLPDQAITKLQSLLQEDPDNFNAQLLLATGFLAVGQLSEAENIVKHFPPNRLDETAVKILQAKLMFETELQSAPDLTTLQQLASQSDDLDIKLKLAYRYALNENFQLALDIFIEIMTANRNFKENAARRGILAVFDLLEGSGPLVNLYRSKMSRLLY